MTYFDKLTLANLYSVSVDQVILGAEFDDSMSFCIDYQDKRGKQCGLISYENLKLHGIGSSRRQEKPTLNRRYYFSKPKSRRSRKSKSKSKFKSKKRIIKRKLRSRSRKFNKR